MEALIMIGLGLIIFGVPLALFCLLVYVLCFVIAVPIALAQALWDSTRKF